MNEAPEKMYWMGQDIEEMSREGLIEVVRYLSVKQREYLSPDSIQAYALGKVEMLKRGMRLSS